MQKLSTREDVIAAYDSLREEIIGSPQWMAVVFVIRNGKIEAKKVTCNYPHEDHEASVSSLKRMLLEDRMMFAGVREPLPLAPHLIKEEGITVGGLDENFRQRVADEVKKQNGVPSQQKVYDQGILKDICSGDPSPFSDLPTTPPEPADNDQIGDAECDH